MTIKNSIDYKAYIECVNDIVNAFFDEDGQYVPHIGRVVLRSIFVDYFVSDFNELDGKEGDDLIETILNNDVIGDAFKNALGDYSSDAFNFNSAYIDAMDIIDYRKSSLVQGVSMFTSAVEAIMSPDNLEKIYEVSERLKKIAAADKDNVTPLFPHKQA